jgi:protein TonB
VIAAARSTLSGDVRRWSASLTLVLAAHGLLALGLLRWERPLDGAPILPPAMMIDLPAAPRVAPPEPPLVLPPPEPPTPVAPEELIEKIELQEVPEVVAPEVVLPPPPKPHPKPPPPKPVQKQVDKPKPVPAPPPAAPAPLVDAPVLAAPPPSAAPSADVRLQFQALLLGHLERHMRYPRAAQMKNQHGTAYLHLVMDRSGKVLEAGVARSSGYAVLDREVMKTLERAQPLPAIPPSLGLDRLDVVVPMEFKLRGPG